MQAISELNRFPELRGMTTIRIAESFPTSSRATTDIASPTRKATDITDASIASGIAPGGAYTFRNETFSLGRRLTRRSSFGGRSQRTGFVDAPDEDAGLRRAEDFKTKQVRWPDLELYRTNLDRSFRGFNWRGSRTNPLASFMAILALHLSMCTPRRSPRTLRIRIFLASCPLSSGH